MVSRAEGTRRIYQLNPEGVTKVGEMMRAELEPLGFAVRWVPMTETKRADLLRLYPAAAEVIDLESEPLIKLLQVAAYRELVIRANCE